MFVCVSIVLISCIPVLFTAVSCRAMVQDCVMRMLQGIPLRQFFYYITWDTFLAGHLSSLSPSLFQWLVRTTMLYWYENM